MLPGIQRPWSRVPEYVLIEDLVPSGLMAVNYISSGRCNFSRLQESINLPESTLLYTLLLPHLV